MTNDPAYAQRFIVRKGSIEGSWMVWDRKYRRPAKTSEGVAAGLTKERALVLRDLLTRNYVRDDE